jgi:hypothetical protein
MTTEYKQLVSTVPMETIMREWLKDYSLLNANQTMVGKQWYYDPVKGTVVVVFDVKEEV